MDRATLDSIGMHMSRIVTDKEREGDETCYQTKITFTEISATPAVAMCNVSMIIREGNEITGFCIHALPN